MNLVQKAVVKKGETYLILLRSPAEKYFPGHWDFPGGGLQDNEDPYAGIEREVLEETGLQTKALEVTGVYEMDIDNLGKKTYRYKIYATELIAGDIHLSFEHLAFRWTTRKEILKLQIEPYMRLYFAEHA